MGKKSKPFILSSDAPKPPHRQPYKALLIRAQSSKVNSTDGEATGSQMKPRKQRKAPYKALLIRARSPGLSEESSSESDFSYEADCEASDSSSAESEATNMKPMKNKTARKAPEARLADKEQNKRRRISEKNNNPEETMSWEPEVKKTL
ncbi:unnamed protein product [Arabidopsis thaliana]|uniref:Uncharacterized protein n=2 Tax=Arabidopsis TaxID=3701 RepID=A0A654FS19_ARATH|nr:hypothetical protein ISN44_As04g023780 [Arabidopsis suecica]VYS63625.1 unnamed protein product [Arabidopsis thaliana]